MTQQPFHAKLKERRRLSAANSEKETHHIELCLKDSGLTYHPGDCVKILPTNSPDAVEQMLKKLGAHGDEIVEVKGEQVAALDYLTHCANLARPPKKMEGELGQLLGKFGKLMPRFYSIASAMEHVGDEVHLTVRHLDEGVCTHYLCARTPLDSTVPLHIYHAPHFKLPEDGDVPIIMIGPGTGVAPYRSFLQQRLASGARGKNWLFFGEWTRNGHFFYEEFWRDLETQDKLKLDLAFSRDQAHKIYVQDRVRESADELWQWLQEGAVLYLCGDAKGMTRGVEKALQEVFSRHMPEEETRSYLKELKNTDRYQKDVY